MCGISGIISKSNAPIPEERIKRINNLVGHRGPDGEGYYFGSNFAFGHRRLAILDLSERGRQPMCYQDRYWITHNGEIYNYLEIRRDLEAKGHAFITGTDTEVILAAYAEWGPECLTQFNGMWAFAIYDALDQKEAAVKAFRAALEIHPNMEAIRRRAEELIEETEGIPL